MIYQVHERLVPFHPGTGLDYGSPTWRLASERRSLRRAIIDAEKLPGLAVVTPVHDAEELHRTDKKPLRVEYDFNRGCATGAS